jgi:hypothetical protein
VAVSLFVSFSEAELLEVQRLWVICNKAFSHFLKKEKKKSKNLSKIVTMGIGEQAEGLCEPSSGEGLCEQVSKCGMD